MQRVTCASGWARGVVGVLAVLVAAPLAPGQLGRPAEKPKPPPEAEVAVTARSGEVRAAWLRFGEGDALATPAKTAETMKRLRDVGFNAVYVVVWQDGWPLFPSEAYGKAAGGVNKLPALSGRDLLSETLIEAHRNGLLYVASFEGGLSATRRDQESALRKGRDGWLLRDDKGAASGPLGSSWMSPVHDEVRDLLKGMVQEVVERYDIDGVQFSERVCWPGTDLGYDAPTREAYAKAHAGQAMPTDGRDAGLARWRAQRAAALVRELVGVVREKRPGVFVSLSGPASKSGMDEWACDWPAWAKSGLFDEIAVRCFSNDAAGFAAAWAEANRHLGARRPLATVAIRAAGDGPDLSWADLRKQIETVREAKVGGIAFSSSRSPLFTHATALTEFFAVGKDGRVRHTLRGLEWRPGPLKPEAMNSKGQYLVVKGLPSSFYRVIAGTGPGAWVEAPIKIAERAATMSPEVAEIIGRGGQIEFLVDRRPENLMPLPNPDAPPEKKPELGKGEKPPKKDGSGGTKPLGGGGG